MGDGRLNSINIAKQCVELTTLDVSHINFTTHFTGSGECGLEKVETVKVLCMKIIGSLQSVWPSPTTLAPIKDVSQLFCIDFRKLNAVASRMPMESTMHDFPDWLGKVPIFSAFYEVMGNHKWRSMSGTKSNDVYKAPCSIESLANAFSSEERTEHVSTRDKHFSISLQGPILHRVPGICIHVRCSQEHIDHLRALLNMLWRADVSLKVMKCFFFEDFIDFWITQYSLEELIYWQKPSMRLAWFNYPLTYRKKLASWGLQCMQRFVQNFARKASLLNCNIGYTSILTPDGSKRLK